MSRGLTPPPYCPTEIGVMRDCNASAVRLHDYIMRGKLRKLKRLLKKGVDVECQNTAGQTPLFISALFGHYQETDLLLQYGANPNKRTFNGSTPVHAAAFSCNPSILCRILEAGGDLRLHDREGKTPQDWAEAAEDSRNVEILEYIRHCRCQMVRFSQHIEPFGTRKVILSCNPSYLSPRRRTRRWLSPFRLLQPSTSTIQQNIHSFGFGKFYLDNVHISGFVASTPIAAEGELIQAENELDRSFENGPFTVMKNLLWNGQQVSVRELKPPSHPHCSRPHGITDLLISDQEHCRHFHHPNILLLMAVCLSSDPEHLQLVYERIEFGSLYNLLHVQRSESSFLTSEMIVRLLLQICEALMYLHFRGYIHRALTSHAVQLVLPGVAKLSNFEYTGKWSENGFCMDVFSSPIPLQLYNWLPLEVIREQPTTVKSDIYSYCTIVQELFTDTVPWQGQDGMMVKELMVSGLTLSTDIRVPQPFFHLVKSGLCLRRRDRTVTLQDMKYSLRSSLQDVMRNSERHISMTGLPPIPQASPPRLYPDINSVRWAEQDEVDAEELPGYFFPAEVDDKDVLYYEMDRLSKASLSTASSEPRSLPSEDQYCSIDDVGPTATPGNDPLCTAQPTLPVEEITTRLTPGDAQGERDLGMDEMCIRKTGLISLLDVPQLSSAASTSVDTAAARQTTRQKREKIKGYSVRQGVEFEVDSESSLLLETVCISTEQEGSVSEAEEPLCPDIRCSVSEDETASTNSKTFLESSLCEEHLLITNLHESAALLDEAQTSLDRLEEHFTSGINTLQQLTNQKKSILCFGSKSKPSFTDLKEVDQNGESHYEAERVSIGVPSSGDCSYSSTKPQDHKVAEPPGIDVADCFVFRSLDEEKQGGFNMEPSTPAKGSASPSTEPPVPCRPPVHLWRVGIRPAIKQISSAARGVCYSHSDRISRSRDPSKPHQSDYRHTVCGFDLGVTEKSTSLRRLQDHRSLQGVTDFSSWVLNRDRQTSLAGNDFAEVLDNQVVPVKAPEDQQHLKETEAGLDATFTGLESLDLMQEIIEELKISRCRALDNTATSSQPELLNKELGEGTVASGSGYTSKT
ncbi:inactive serine/threonine-protein kinase TEX14-like [Protopterus annectens]|uniref:inactive serine/threonine-protein kinase TEX14-like n=1 Tax=Protopterus annectens TaxID=7888 RepID=UPI001CFBBB0F|nr:inactive serine/threonine-protein kinase TEX14-like [Protopterus annectens]